LISAKERCPSAAAVRGRSSESTRCSDVLQIASSCTSAATRPSSSGTCCSMPARSSRWKPRVWTVDSGQLTVDSGQSPRDSPRSFTTVNCPLTTVKFVIRHSVVIRISSLVIMIQRMWRQHDLKDHYDVVVIGGGVHGLATAYYLTKMGVRD